MQNTMNSSITILPAPTIKTAFTAPKVIPTDSSLGEFLTGVMQDVRACTDATNTDSLPSILARDDTTPSGTGYYMQAHLGSIRGKLQAALTNVKILNPTDVETVLRAVAIELVNGYTRTRTQELQATLRGTEESRSDSLKEQIQARLMACMQRAALSREFSTSEVELLVKQAEEGNHRIAENMAGRDVRFLAESTDWQSLADALCSIPGAGAVTVSIEPINVQGNSVMLKPGINGWSLHIWADASWLPIQASLGVFEQVQAERAMLDKVRRDSGKLPLNTGGGLFADELR
ncbi:MAG: hypothetical protein [Bacteriophage sp.]|nr:MAG: hypothetical protein [Bacteriophage sp.]